MFFLSLLKELATDIQSLEQFDPTAQNNLNRNLFIILLHIHCIYYYCHFIKRIISEVLISLWGKNLLFILLMNATFIAEILFTLYFNEMFWH